MPLDGFQARLRDMRVSRKLSQAQAAALVGATTTQWGNWERHNITAEPNLAMLAAIAQAFKVSIDWLILGEASIALQGGESPAPTPRPSPTRVVRARIAVAQRALLDATAALDDAEADDVA